MVTGPTRVYMHELPQVKAHNDRSHTNSTRDRIYLICICCTSFTMPDTTIQFHVVSHGIVCGCCCVSGQAAHFRVYQQTLEVEVPDGPDGQHCQTNCPADDHMAWQRLGESVPVKLQCYQNLRDDDGYQQHCLRTNLLAKTTE